MARAAAIPTKGDGGQKRSKAGSLRRRRQLAGNQAGGFAEKRRGWNKVTPAMSVPLEWCSTEEHDAHLQKNEADCDDSISYASLRPRSMPVPKDWLIG